MLGRWQKMASLVEFMVRAKRAAVWHGANMPSLAWLNPHRTVVFYSNNVESAPLPGYTRRMQRFSAAHYAFCSRYTHDGFRRLYPEIPAERCFVVHEAVDADTFHPSPSGSRAANSVKRLFFLGNWSKEKGIFALVETIHKLRELRPKHDYAWVIGGATSYWKSDPVAAEHIEQTMHRLAAQVPNVEVIGEVDYKRYPEILREMDIFVNPAVWEEPFPLVNLEAMASGLPVVASKVGGIPELVRHNVNGLLVPAGNAVALAKSLTELLDQSVTIQKMSQAARATILNGFTWTHHVTKLAQVYRRILAQQEHA
jgi:glycosyltransferase involved in cell wall biosynthesis